MVVSIGCAGVRLISDYDEATDQGLTRIQKTTDDFIEFLKRSAGTPAASFEKSTAFYTGIDRDLRQLEFRVRAIPRNDGTVALVQDIRAAILGTGLCSADGTSPRELPCLAANRTRGPSVTALAIAQRNINQTISAALSLELAKRQGTGGAD